MNRSYARQTAILIAGFFVGSTVFAQSLTSTDTARVIDVVNDYRSAREAIIVNDFVELLSLPNVAVSLSDMERNADHIESLLETRGFSIRRLSAGGSPYIYAELSSPGAAETVLIYAHFDGQPVQEENWAYPPFSHPVGCANAGGRQSD